MARRKHGELHARSISNMRLHTTEILCEECGVIYDLRSERGICGYCAGHAARLEEQPDPEEQR